MPGNGKRIPPRPRIELVSGGASDAERAAIVAALELHLAQSAPPPVATEVSRWQQAALRDGVSRDPGRQAWGVG